MDQTQRLPEDLHADVLRCLPPRSLAAARCVCRSWHAIVDAHRLLDRDLLPLSLAGFLINFCELDFTEFFFDPSAIRGYADLHFMPTDDISVDDGDALGTLADMLLLELPMPDELYAVYWHGEIYVHCHFVMRISLSSGTYQAIKLPTDVDQHRWAQVLLGRSEKGVYFAALDGQCHLRVWILTECCGQSEWFLKHDNNLHQIPPPQNYDPQVHRPCWIMADINPAIYSTVKKKFELNSDHEIIFETRLEGRRWDEHIKILGFHPYKEIIYFSETLNRGYAYHLDELKLEDLGNMRPKGLDDCYNKELERSIPYTPCLLGP
ncbi:hypothetical protein CFC21_076297 [Triticum aestivum]|uniref:F-box domain-containing protein n=2 Tax=Triticum aestivum TaxID=4565 RepID=A0A9R1HST7_WHEAT|nr:hypothetical protein CFC21_076297 [Triticum aestivum]